jgi:hypothetical protein
MNVCYDENYVIMLTFRIMYGSLFRAKLAIFSCLIDFLAKSIATSESDHEHIQKLLEKIDMQK